MSLTEKTEIDKIEIVGEFAILHIREATTIERDGVALDPIYHRRVVVPGADLSGEPQKVKDIAAVVHTPEVVKAYVAAMKEAEAMQAMMQG